jgi:hypothetical protein
LQLPVRRERRAHAVPGRQLVSRWRHHNVRRGAAHALLHARAIDNAEQLADVERRLRQQALLGHLNFGRTRLDHSQ